MVVCMAGHLARVSLFGIERVRVSSRAFVCRPFRAEAEYVHGAPARPVPVPSRAPAATSTTTTSASTRSWDGPSLFG